MTFPTKIAVSGGNSGADATTHTINLPDGSNVTGRLICVFFCVDSIPTVTWPSGWTNFSGLPSSAGSAQLEGRWHVVDGSEGYPSTGATISLTTDSAQGSGHNSILFGDHDSSTNAPTGATAASGSSTAPNPPTCSPGVSKDFCYIAITDHRGDSVTTVYPTNYIDGFENRWNSSSGESCSTAFQNLNATSDDPGTFTISPSATWIAFTVSIHPGAEGPTGGDVFFENRHPIEEGMKPQTAAGMGGILIG